MAVAGFSGGLNFNSSGNFNSDSFNKFQDFFKSSPQPPTEKLTQVLGESTTPLTTIFQQIIAATPPALFIMLALEILLAVIMFIVISLLSRAWSKASLIQSIQTALNDQKPTIRDSSEKAFSTIKPLIWLDIVPTLIFILITIMLVFGIFLLAGIMSGAGMKILSIILIIVVILVLLYALILFNLTHIWSLRIAVLDKLSGSASFIKGFKLARKKFWSMILLGLVNIILTGLIIGVPVAIMVGLIFGGIFSLKANLSLAVVLLFFGGILAIAFILGYLLLSGILTAFKASVWTIAYNNIKEKYHV